MPLIDRASSTVRSQARTEKKRRQTTTATLTRQERSANAARGESSRSATLRGAGPVERDVLARLPDAAPLEAEHVDLVGRRLSPRGDLVRPRLASRRVVHLHALPG